jgi:hypothetical protein
MSRALRDEPSSVEAQSAAVTRPKRMGITAASVPGADHPGEPCAARLRLARSRALCYHARPCPAPFVPTAEPVIPAP